ncbi:MAG: GIY-YIG nuclease family protein [Chloroflexota bacterium]
MATNAVGWSVYLLRCGDGTYYTGITTDVERRLAQHAAGHGARYTRGRGPLALVGVVACADHAAALRLEARLKPLGPAARLRALAAVAPADELTLEETADEGTPGLRPQRPRSRPARR